MIELVNHSLCSALTGLAIEARSDSYPTDSIVITAIAATAPAKTQTDKSVRYSKLCNHRPDK